MGIDVRCQYCYCDCDGKYIQRSPKCCFLIVILKCKKMCIFYTTIFCYKDFKIASYPCQVCKVNVIYLFSFKKLSIT